MASTTLSTSNTTTSSAQTTKRLTGWAQAAARSAPSNIKKSEKQVELKVTKLAGSNDSASSSKKKTSTPNSNANHSINNNSKSSGSGTVSNKKHFNKQSFNRNEVRSYMNDLFLKYEKSPKTLSYQNVVKNNKNSPNETWGTVQSKSNRNKNKKYGLLTDVAKLLK